MKLRGLKARSVRGIPRDWPDLPIGERGMVVFGPNGVGKSSIVDALEYAISARTSLYPVGRQNVNWEAGAPHIRGGDPDIAVEVSGGGRTFELAPDHEPDDISDDGRAWIATARNASFVLRRHMLLNFITAQPSGRYSLLEPFMNLGDYQGIEDGLRDWKDQLEGAHTVAAATVAERKGPLRAIFDVGLGQPLTEEALLARLNAVLQALDLAEVPAREELENRQAQIGGELGGAEQNARLATLGSLKTEAQRLGRATDLVDMLNALIAALDGLERELATRTDAILTDLLVSGKEAIEAAGLDACPLCEQDIDREAVVARLDERIEADERVTAARQTVSRRRQALLERVRNLAHPMAQFSGHWGEHIGTPLPTEYAQTIALLSEMEAELGMERPKNGEMRDFVPRLAASMENHAGVIGILDGLIVGEGGGERRTRLTSAASMIEALLTDWPRYMKAVDRCRSIERMKSTVTRLHGHAVEARKNAVRTTLDDVAVLANAFYESIHPGEGIATSGLQVRDVGQGSVILSTDFHGTRENPLLHYSESHLDTLGLCYFLALRRHEASKAPEFKVLVLDDVMHSVDADHRGRIASLIKSEFADHQVIITTHDVYFYDALRRELGTGGYTYGRIYNWDLERGPVFGDPLTDFARIIVPEEREKLAQETLSAAGGRFFEWLLREITESLEVPIPARFKRSHEIGQLWPPLAARLRRQQGYATAHQGLTEDLEQNAWVRNACGAHYNPAPAPPTPKEVRDFAAMLAALYETLFCKDCGAFISRQADESWCCPTGHVRYARTATKPA